MTYIHRPVQQVPGEHQCDGTREETLLQAVPWQEVRPQGIRIRRWRWSFGHGQGGEIRKQGVRDGVSTVQEL